MLPVPRQGAKSSLPRRPGQLSDQELQQSKRHGLEKNFPCESTRLADYEILKFSRSISRKIEKTDSKCKHRTIRCAAPHHSKFTYEKTRNGAGQRMVRACTR